jgi:glycine/D-amino acid oxidase-like deaminating enzyme
MLPIEQTCFWLAQRPPRAFVSLTRDTEAEVAVVGAGLTGLWTALFLKELEPAADVAVIDQGLVAYGASGRNAGMLSETIDHGHSLAIQHFGEAETRRLARLGETNVAEMLDFLGRRGIDCDYEPTGRLMVALTPSHLDEARTTVETAERLGLTGYRLLDQQAIRSELGSPLYLGGVWVSGGGILDPVKLVEGLRSEAEQVGVRVFEHTPVMSVEAANGEVRVRTHNGTARARRVVLATSAYTHHLLPQVTRRFIPLYDYVLVSDPLSQEQQARIGWTHRQGVTDGRAFFNYYRLTWDNRILWGTSEATYYRGNRVDRSCDHSPGHYQALRVSFRRHFPGLAELEFPFAWGGAICATTRLTPFFGSALGGRLVYGLGFTGHGLGSTRLAGRILAHLTLNRPTELLDLALVRRLPLPYPPEPLRSWSVAAVTRALRQADQGTPPGWLLRTLNRMGIGFSS